MSAFWKRAVVPAVLISAMLISSCGHNAARLNRAAIGQGKAQASFPPAPVPDECLTDEPHAAVHVGAEARSVLKRERSALNRSNASKRRCAQFTQDIITGWTAKGE